jgi:hypothetical protein
MLPHVASDGAPTNVLSRGEQARSLRPVNVTEFAVGRESGPTPLHGQGHPLPAGALDGSKICRTQKATLNFLFTYHRGRGRVAPCLALLEGEKSNNRTLASF